MVDYTNVKINKNIKHIVGNSFREEKCVQGSGELYTENHVHEKLLLRFFLSGLESNPVEYRFYHEINLSDNNVFRITNNLFDNNSDFISYSIEYMQKLHDATRHPRLQIADLFVVLFEDVIYNDEITNAVGLFKKEKTDMFYNTEDGIISFNKAKLANNVDWGCVILNTDRKYGYTVHLIDNLKDKNLYEYWVENFLKVRKKRNDRYITEKTVDVIKKFTDELRGNEKVDFVKKSKQYFNDNNSFDKEVFVEDVVNDNAKFNEYWQDYENTNDILLDDQFDIDKTEVKKRSRSLKPVLKLDKNFRVYVHGGSELMERGFDREKGKYYYKFYFEKER